MRIAKLHRSLVGAQVNRFPCILLLLTLGCDQAPTEILTLCDGAMPKCFGRSSPCAPLDGVMAECGADRTWRCPMGAQESFAPVELDCRPYRAALGSVSAMGPSFEIDGACYAGVGAQTWVIDRVAPYPDPIRCPQAPPAGPAIDRRSIEPDLLVDITDTIHLAEGTFAYYRLYRPQDGAPFGFAEAGSGVAPVQEGQVRLPAQTMWQDAGYRSVTEFEGQVYVSHCGGAAENLRFNCSIDRVFSGRLMEALAYERVDANSFTAGPQHSLRYYPGRGLVMATAVGFGDRLEVLVGGRPGGNWTKVGLSLPPCELPDDPDVFCDQVRQHPYLNHPWERASIVVSYRVGSLAPDAQQRRSDNPEAYSVHLIKIPVFQPELNEPFPPG